MRVADQVNIGKDDAISLARLQSQLIPLSPKNNNGTHLITPHVIIIAGPNGAGKSTTTPVVLQGALGVTEFVNADTIE